jgi:hypothetical protein
LEEIDPKIQKALIETVPVEKASDIFEEMSPSEAADLLADPIDQKDRRPRAHVCDKSGPPAQNAPQTVSTQPRRASADFVSTAE